MGVEPVKGWVIVCDLAMWLSQLLYMIVLFDTDR